MAEFIDAALTQEVVDAKNELQTQAERAKVIVDYWDGLVPNGGGGGDVASVNGGTGVVVITTDDIDDSTDVNKFTTAADITRLENVEAGAQVNLFNFTDAPSDGFEYAREDGAWVRVTGGGGGNVSSVNGEVGVVVLDADDISDASTVNKFTTAADITKLSGISSFATLNSSDATLLARANHTGTQAASTISDFDTEVSNNTSVVANTAKVSFPEAPSDGTQYARKDAGWEAIVSGGGGGVSFEMVYESYTDFTTYSTIQSLGAGIYSAAGSNSDTTNGLPYKTSTDTFTVEVKESAAENTFTLEATLYYTTLSSPKTNLIGSKWFRTVSNTEDSGWLKGTENGGNVSGVSGDTHAGIKAAIEAGTLREGVNVVLSSDMGLTTSGATFMVFDIQTLSGGYYYQVRASCYNGTPVVQARTYIRTIPEFGDSSWVQLTGT